MALPPCWHGLRPAPGHAAAMETHVVGRRSSLGLEAPAAHVRDCQGEEVWPRQPTALDWLRPRPRLLALSKPLWVPARAPRAAPSVATAKTSLAPEVPEPWQPLHWGARPSFGDWKLKSSLSSQSFHRDANNPLGCK